MKQIPLLIVLALAVSLCKFTGRVGNGNNNNDNVAVTNSNEANTNSSPTTDDSPVAENTPTDTPTPQAGAGEAGGVEQGEVEEALLSIKRQWTEAIINGDVAANERILANEFVNTDPQGQTVDRATFIQALGQPAPGATYTIDEPRLINYSTTSAIMTYLVAIKHQRRTSSPATGGARRRS
jgi:hypothetical protein